MGFRQIMVTRIEVDISIDNMISDFKQIRSDIDSFGFCYERGSELREFLRSLPPAVQPSRYEIMEKVLNATGNMHVGDVLAINKGLAPDYDFSPVRIFKWGGRGFPSEDFLEAHQISLEQVEIRCPHYENISEIR